MSRRSRDRGRRRERKQERASERERDKPVRNAPVNWSRLRQLFENLQCRREAPTFRGYVLSSISVEARTPDDLAQKMAEIWIGQTRNGPEN